MALNSQSQCVHFCSLRKIFNPAIKLEKTEILVIDQNKFLGDIFDKN